MAAKGNFWATAILKLFFNGTAVAGVAQNNAAPYSGFYISLHTSSPGAGGTQTTNEAAYTSYARVFATPRSSAEFLVSGSSMGMVNPITFPTATGGSETETYFAIGDTLAAAGDIYYFGPISPTIAVSIGITPQLTTASVVTES
jgi:hypothetical protein